MTRRLFAAGRLSRNRHVEDDDATFPPDARYTIAGWRGVAFWVDGWETEPDEDTEWTGIEERTGRVLVVMVGDDRRHAVDPEDLEELGELDYCTECGQIGCTHDGREREPDHSIPDDGATADGFAPDESA